MMSSPPDRSIMTDGDAKVNIINTFGDLIHVAYSLTSTINLLHEFMTEKVDDGLTKKIF